MIVMQTVVALRRYPLKSARLSQAELPADLSVLSDLARHYRIPAAGLGRAACFGPYAGVVQPGRLRLGPLVR
ncbi:hypothetical protein GCM10027290_25890 [Micromonospora sonneratiae]